MRTFAGSLTGLVANLMSSRVSTWESMLNPVASLQSLSRPLALALTCHSKVQGLSVGGCQQFEDRQPLSGVWPLLKIAKSYSTPPWGWTQSEGVLPSRDTDQLPGLELTGFGGLVPPPFLTWKLMWYSGPTQLPFCQSCQTLSYEPSPVGAVIGWSE